jgi:tripartite-type tricarboxylate transporter receptor subunit TctC
MRPGRREMGSRIAALMLGIGLVAPVLAQVSTKPTRIIVGFPAGGATDVIARLIADRLRGSLSPSVIVENRVGASGRLAAELVKAGDPDGSILLFTPDFLMTVYPHSFKKLSYDPLKDFAPVASVTRSMLTFVAGPGLPASITTVDGFVQWAKANPKLANYGTTSAGGSPHFVGVMLARATGLDLTAAHYKGGAPALTDLLGGQIPVSVNPVSESLPYVKSGKLRVLGVTGRARSRFMPDVPTFGEQGFKDIWVESWIGFLAPAKTPPETINRLNAAIGEALKSNEVMQGLEKFSTTAELSTAAGLGEMLRTDLERWGPIVKASGFNAED